MLFLSVGNLQAIKEENYKNTKVTLQVTNATLSNVLNRLSELANVKFFYNHAQIDINNQVTVNLKDRELSYVLEVVLGSQSISIEYHMNRVIVLKPRVAIAMNVPIHKVSGKIIDAVTKEVLPGASIVMKEKLGLGVVTDAEGNFFIEIPEGITALVITYVGYESEQLPFAWRCTVGKFRCY